MTFRELVPLILRIVIDVRRFLLFSFFLLLFSFLFSLVFLFLPLFVSIFVAFFLFYQWLRLFLFLFSLRRDLLHFSDSLADF